MPIFLDHALQGPFLEPGFVWEQDLVGYTSSGSPGELGASATTSSPVPVMATVQGPEMLVGWQWTYAAHLTLSAAAGVMRVLYPMAVGQLPGSTTEYQWYLNAGYAF